MSEIEQFNHDMSRIETIILRWQKLKAIRAPKMILDNERVLLNSTMNRILDPKNIGYLAHLTERGKDLLKLFNQFVDEIKPCSRLELILEENNEEALIAEALKVIEEE